MTNSTFENLTRCPKTKKKRKEEDGGKEGISFVLLIYRTNSSARGITKPEHINDEGQNSADMNI